MNDDDARAIIRLAGPVGAPSPGIDPARLLAVGRRQRRRRNIGVVAGSALATAAVVVLVVATPKHEPATTPLQPATQLTVSTSPSPLSTSDIPATSTVATTPRSTTTTN
jgi:hypothetical protein